ncbi:hypothetical protein B1J94_00115 [Leptospira kirschneri serovar Grippotyphosa]|nr:hypothetical protein B1J94_00115 [Leptospira kirschneri serovar Grippotyphosa]
MSEFSQKSSQPIFKISYEFLHFEKLKQYLPKLNASLLWSLCRSVFRILDQLLMKNGRKLIFQQL